jgi:hypothetical protein
LFITSNFGVKPCFLRSLRISFSVGPAVTPALYQHVEDLALMVDGTPENIRVPPIRR